MKTIQENETVKKTVLNLGLMKPGEQFEYFADELCRVFSKYSCEKADNRKDFPALFNILQMGSDQISIIENPPILRYRTRQHAGQVTNHYFFLDLVLQGEAHYSQGGDRRIIRQGDFYIGCTMEPYNCRFYHNKSCKLLIIVLKDECLQSDETRMELLNSRRFTQHRLVPLLRMTMKQLARSMNTANTDESSKLLTMVKNLIFLIANDRESFSRYRPDENQIFNLIESEIDVCLREQSLSLDGISLRLGLSKHRIQRVLSRNQTNFTEFVRQKRLELGLRELQNTAFAYKSIAEIAYDCGYSEQASFHRAFKRKYNRTPGEIQSETRKTLQCYTAGGSNVSSELQETLNAF